MMKFGSHPSLNSLPVRSGLPPAVMPYTPQSQLDQLPPIEFKQILIQRLQQFSDVTFGPSQRARFHYKEF